MTGTLSIFSVIGIPVGVRVWRIGVRLHSEDWASDRSLVSDVVFTYFECAWNALIMGIFNAVFQWSEHACVDSSLSWRTFLYILFVVMAVCTLASLATSMVLCLTVRGVYTNHVSLSEARRQGASVPFSLAGFSPRTALDMGSVVIAATSSQRVVSRL